MSRGGGISRGGSRGGLVSRGKPNFRNDNSKRFNNNKQNNRGKPLVSRDKNSNKKSFSKHRGIGGKVVVVEHRFQGVFIAKGSTDSLLTRNMVPGISIYGEKRVEVNNQNYEKIEYRVWNPFRSKLGAAILGGIESMPIVPGSRVLYLGAANGTTVSHVSDMVGPEGVVYAVEFSLRSGRDLTTMATRRHNIVPIVEDARCPLRYRMLVDSVDVLFSDVAQPDQARIVALNASYFLKNDGWVIMSIKANCVDSAAPPESVYAAEVNKLRQEQFKPMEQLTLEPYHTDHAVIIGKYRVTPKSSDS